MNSYVIKIIISPFLTSIFCITYLNGQELKGVANSIYIADASKYSISEKAAFIENVGQYDSVLRNANIGKIRFSYEAFKNPVLFTNKGIVYLQELSRGNNEEEEKEIFEPIEKEKRHRKRKGGSIRHTITMEWLNANPSPEIIMEERTNAYHTFGFLQSKASSYKRITYKELYPGIDVVYFIDENRVGFEYNIIVKPGSNPGVIKMFYGGDLSKINLDFKGNLHAKSSIGGISESVPVSYLVERQEELKSPNTKEQIRVRYKLIGNEVSFNLPPKFTSTKMLVIDPFVSTTDNLTGFLQRKAKDIDFDYAGNVYVTGGDIGNCRLAKYNSNGVLQWTFDGFTNTTFFPYYWNFGANDGGWVVDKNTGSIYLGQGFDFLGNTGTYIIRLNTDGVFDNFQTIPVQAFRENWKMIWNCNNGIPQILAGGGGTPSNISLTFVSPPANTISPINITGIPFGRNQGIVGNPGCCQDIADLILDPKTGELYSLFSSSGISGRAGTPEINNFVFKHSSPFTANDIKWKVYSGYTVLTEGLNRPYLHLGNRLEPDDNSVNVLAVNSSYLFYWDGVNLKAFDKVTGATVGNSISVLTNKALWQGGIVADECNNVFVGSTNGTIKVYKFDGNTFQDNIAPDISIPSFPNSSVYDLAYSDDKKILYASGDGFVASFDVSAYCNAQIYSLSVIPNCSDLSAQASITPIVSGASVNYELVSNGVTLDKNTTGYFNGLSTNTKYTLNVYINQACSGIKEATDFSIAGPQLDVKKTDAICGRKGAILVTALGGAQSLAFSIDGINFQNNGNFNNLEAGDYLITVKNSSGCISQYKDTINTITGVNITLDKTDATCGNKNGSININSVGGTAPIVYSIDGVNFQTANFFTELDSGTYTVTAKDGNNCISQMNISIVNSGKPSLDLKKTDAQCGNNTGSITANGIGGTGSLEYSIDGINYVPNGVFNYLSPGTYTVQVRDQSGCTTSQQSVINLGPPIFVNIPNDTTICEGAQVEISAASNAVSFMWSPSAGLDDPNKLKPVASPIGTTTYSLTATSGLCSTSDSVTFFVNQAPVPSAGNDTTICLGKSVQLDGQGGQKYIWSPDAYLDNPFISNPTVVKPESTTIYYLTVIGANGCKSIKPDDVTVTVKPLGRIFAGNDTTVVINQPLQLNAVDIDNVGYISYKWNPPYGLDDPFIQKPVAILDKNIKYEVTGIDGSGCIAIDDINIKIALRAAIYVPNSFTPNGDGHNDILKAIPIGIRQFKYFAIYNRWGERVFFTSDFAKGWDGKIKGILQNSATFVWQVAGIDFEGHLITGKGTVTLLH